MVCNSTGGKRGPIGKQLRNRTAMWQQAAAAEHHANWRAAVRRCAPLQAHLHLQAQLFPLGRHDTSQVVHTAFEGMGAGWRRGILRAAGHPNNALRIAEDTAAGQREAGGGTHTPELLGELVEYTHGALLRGVVDGNLRKVGVHKARWSQVEQGSGKTARKQYAAAQSWADPAVPPRTWMQRTVSRMSRKPRVWPPLPYTVRGWPTAACTTKRLRAAHGSGWHVS